MPVGCNAKQTASVGDDGEFTVRGLESAESGLIIAERRDLRDLLLEYSDCFVGGSRPLACTNPLLARLDTCHHAKNSQPPSRFSAPLRSATRELVDELKDVDMIERSNSSRGSAILLSKKPGGGLSQCGCKREL